MGFTGILGRFDKQPQMIPVTLSIHGTNKPKTFHYEVLNNSRLTPQEVSGIASAIDVPIYVLAVVSPLDHVGQSSAVVDPKTPPPTGELVDIAQWTGGDMFMSSSASQSSVAMRQIVDELRFQYLIAFEPGTRPGWHPLELRLRDQRLTVRARGGYFAGPSSGS